MGRIDGTGCACADERRLLDAMIDYLAGELSRARILVNNDKCCRCTRMSYDACRACWRGHARRDAEARRASPAGAEG